MSEDWIKTGFRAEIKSLENASIEKIYNYFSKYGIEPEEYDEDYIYYKNKENDFTPMLTANKVFLDYLLTYDPIYDAKNVKIKFEEIEKILNEYTVKFNIEKSEIELFSYIWYTGIDEPFYIEW